MTEIDGTSPAQPPTPSRELDATGLRALAHPLRVRILGLLNVEGPATSAALSRRLAIRSGSTSWHLSKLAEHGLIEEVPDRGTRRERWWRAVSPGWSLDAARYLGDPATSDEATALLAAAIDEQFRRARRFLAEEWDARWRASWILDSGRPLRLAPDGLAALREDLMAVLARYAGAAPDGAMPDGAVPEGAAPDGTALVGPAPDEAVETVLVQIQGFPVRADEPS